jgi:hypothetical protein
VPSATGTGLVPSEIGMVGEPFSANVVNPGDGVAPVHLERVINQAVIRLVGDLVCGENLF